jgi:hypothetical protein
MRYPVRDLLSSHAMRYPVRDLLSSHAMRYPVRDLSPGRRHSSVSAAGIW